MVQTSEILTHICYKTLVIILTWLVVLTCFNHLEKCEFVNGKDYFQYMESHKIHVPNHQPDMENHNL